MYLLQSLLAAVFLAAQIGAFISCNNVSNIYNCSDGAITTTTTTVTPIVTILVGPNSTNVMGTYNSTRGTVTVTTTVFVTTPCPTLAARSLSPEAMDNIQIGTAMHSYDQGPLAFNDRTTLDSGTAITAMPILNPRNLPMAPNDVFVVAASSTTSSAAWQSVIEASSFGFNTTGSNCNSSAQPSTTTMTSSSLSPTRANPLNTTTTGTGTNTTTDLPTLPPSSQTPPPPTSATSSDTAQSTSTTVVVVSLTTATPSTTTTTPTSTTSPPTKSTSPATPVFSWLNILWLVVFAKEACSAISRIFDAFGSSVEAEEAKLVLGSGGKDDMQKQEQGQLGCEE